MVVVLCHGVRGVAVFPASQPGVHAASPEQWLGLRFGWIMLCVLGASSRAAVDTVSSRVELFPIRQRGCGCSCLPFSS
jgi:hypothetical protein